jgi:hypothetical protein
MAKYAVLRGGQVAEIREMESADHLAHKVDAVKDGGDGGPFVRPYHDPGAPDFNNEIETLLTERKVTLKAVEVSYSVTSRDIDDARRMVKAQIDKFAERERMKHLTRGDGQMLEYAYALAEAKAFQADAAGDYPLLQASVNAGEVKTLAEAAALVLERNNAWLKAGALIRERRLAAKLEVDAAEGAREAWAILKAVKWS